MKQTILLLLAAISFNASAQTAEEVVSNYIRFTGGTDNWKKIKTITATGAYNYGGLEFPFESFSKSPDLYKYVVTANGKSFMQAFDGKEGWRIDGFKDETAKTRLQGKEAKAMANEMEVETESPFVDYRQKGYSISLEGTDTVNGKTCFKIKLTKKDGDTATYYFDRNNFALLKKQAASTNSELDKAPLDTFYSDYRAAGGIQWPHKITHTSNGQEILIVTIKTIELNKPIDDSIFKF